MKKTTGLLLITLAVSSVAIGQERQQLEQRKRQLEAELAKIAVKLEDLKGRTSSTPTGEVTDFGHFIDAFGIFTVDSAGGVQPHITLRNPNPRSPIKYARFALQLFDRVGSPLTSTIGDQSPTRWVRATGPIKFEDDPSVLTWNPVWYNLIWSPKNGRHEVC